MKKTAIFLFLVISLLAQGSLVSKSVQAQVINDFVAPAGGENWQAGTIHRIYWTGRPSGERFIELFYQKSDGTGKISIVYKSDTSYGSGNDQLWYDWAIPSGLAPGSYKVVAESVRSGSVYRTSISNSFNITAMTPAGASGDFSVSSPAEGGEWQVARTYIIRWTPPTSFPADIVNIYLVGGGFITSGSPSTLNGSYSWTVPSGMSPGFYQIGVRYVRQADERERTSGASVFGRSGSFRVVSSGDGGDPGQTGTARFLLPAGGEIWQQGQTGVLRWNTPASWPVNEVTLALADPNGNYLRGIAIVKNNVPDSILGGGDFSWIIPTSVASGTYKMKATVNRSDTTTPNVILSNQFTIGSPIPGGGTNQPPVISRVDGPTSLNVGQSGTWTVSASDPNGDALTYEVTWGDGSAAPAGATAVLTHTFTVAGTYSLVFRVKDAGGLSAQYPLTVTVTAPSGGGPVAVGDRVVVTGNVNVRVEPNGSYILGTQYKDILYSGFRQYAPAKGVVVEGARTVGGYTWVKVNYDYGPDGWSAVDYLSSLGQISGWEFTPDNILGRKIQPSQGAIFVEPYYYYVENGQVSIPSSFAQASLPPEALNILTGIQGAWNCQAISDASPFRWVGYRCKYGRGNQPPTIASFTGPTSTFTNVPGTWRFQAADPEGALASYKVDWGDSSAVTPVSISGASVTQELSHTYAQTGTFTIKLTVADGGGLMAEATLSLQVAAPCSTRFQIGDRVKVINTSAEQDLRVRETPNGTILGNKANGATGTIIGGPSSANNYCWWQIDYDSQPDGWSAEGGGGVYWLERVSGGTPGPAGTAGVDRGIVITSPAAGDIWNIGDPIVIRWTAPTVVTRVHIYLAGVGLIASNIPNTGSYSWVVPSILNGRALGGSILAITVYAADPNVVYFGTSGQFTVGTGGPQPVSGGLSCANPIFLRQDVVMTSAGMNVRATPGISNNVVGQQPLGSRGTVIADSQCDSGSTYRWWSVNFDLGPDGWVVQDYLTLVNRPGGGTLNQPPALSPISGSANVTVNTSASWQVSATDNDSVSLTYTVSWGDGSSNSTYTGASGQSVSISHTYSQTGSRTITVTVSDGQLTDTEILTVNVGVAGPNQPPVLDPFTAPNQATVNVNTTWQAKAVDPDGTALDYTFNWGDGMPVSTFTNIASGQSVPAQHTFTQTGSRTITVTASDSQLSDTESLIVTVSSTVVNLPPVLTITGPTQVYVFESRPWQFLARDTPNSPNIPTVTINYSIDLGDGTKTTRTGTVGPSGVSDEFVIHTYKAPGDYVITVVASDGQLSTTQTYNVKVLELSDPVISSFTGPATLAANTLGTWQVTATASTTMTYSVDWGDGSPLLTGDIWLSGETKTFSHTYLTTGQKNISVTVRGQKVVQVTTQSKTITVGAANAAPAITAFTGSTALGVGVQGSWTVTGVDSEGAMLNYQVEWGDGNFSAYTGNSGAAINIMHTYMMDNPYTIRVTAVDSGALRASRTLAVNVSFPAKTACVARFTGNTVYPYGEDVIVTDAITVRSTASPTGSALVGMGAGTTGKVLEGPVLGGGYCWYKVRYVFGNPPTVPPVGYTADNWLEKASLYAPAATSLTITGSNSLTPNQQGSWRVKAVSTGYGPISYVVNWGDGTSNTYSGGSGAFVTPDPRHAYGQAGIKTIQVTATNARGGAKSVIFEVNVR